MQNVLKTTIHWTTMFFFIANKWSGVLHCRSVCNTIRMCPPWTTSVFKTLYITLLAFSRGARVGTQSDETYASTPLERFDLIQSNPSAVNPVHATLEQKQAWTWTRSDKTSVSTPIQPSVLIRLVKTVHVGLCQLQYLDGTVPVTQWERQKV